MRRTPPAERFEHLYDANLPAILGYAVRRCQDFDEAADVVAETFLVAWRRLDEVPAGAERLWLFGVARRTLANQRRGRLRRSELADRLRLELSTRPVGNDSGCAVEIHLALAQLPEQDRELLALVVWDELTPTEISRLYNIPAATVRSRLLRARTKLRAALADAQFDETDQPHDAPPDKQESAAMVRTRKARS